jgi:hypothetical protein
MRMLSSASLGEHGFALLGFALLGFASLGFALLGFARRARYLDPSGVKSP